MKSLNVNKALRKAEKYIKDGNFADAEKAYSEILAQYPQNQAAIKGMKAIKSTPADSTKQIVPTSYIQELVGLYRQNRFADLIEKGIKVSASYSDSLELCNIIGAGYEKLDEPDNAIAWYQRALGTNPDSSKILVNLGVAYRRKGDIENSILSYQRAIKLDPDFAGAHYNLGNLYKDKRDFESSIASYKKAIKSDSNFVDARYNLGDSLFRIGAIDEAIRSIRELLKIQPRHVAAYNNLGNALREKGEIESAVDAYRKALSINPRYAEAHNNLGVSLSRLGNYEAAIASYKCAIEIIAEYPEAYLNMANTLRESGQLENAIDLYKEALRIKPNFPEAYNNLGNGLREKGENQAAIEAYLTAIDLQHDYAEAYRHLSGLKVYSKEDSDISTMMSLKLNADVTNNQRMHLCFALSKAFEDLENYEEAFRQLKEGNSLRKSQLKYHIEFDKKWFGKLRELFQIDREHPEVQDRVYKEYEKVPIFILGMPRSGTSLVEQILSCHSQVFGAGELEFMNRAIHHTRSMDLELDMERLIAVRREYQSSLKTLNSKEPFVTDKAPLNFRWIGFILTSMPSAKIINVKRDARAVCWSIYKNFFSADGNGYANNIEDVTTYYKMYLELMEHWALKFPGSIYNLDYEKLTESQEQETANLLEYVGLDWEDSCLSFHTSNRPVRTISSEQVRKKMYTGSSQQWRKYEPYLGEMIQALEAV